MGTTGPFNSDKHSSGSPSKAGKLVGSPVVSQAGPLHHRVFLLSSSGSKPLDGRSAGFSFPGQWFQAEVGVNRRISITRFSTNCFHCFVTPLIQAKATLESV